MDRLTPQHRSKLMSRIRAKDTKPELVVRSCVHRLGYRFRLHDRKLPGRPDLVLSRYRTVIFVHGCFWHQHPRCRFAYSPKSRQEFWSEKFQSNGRRDRRVRAALARLGWRVMVIWECETADIPSLVARLRTDLPARRRPR